MVGGFSTHNWPIIVTDSLVRVASWWSLVSGELDYHQNLLKHDEILPDSTSSCQIHSRSSEISLDLTRFLLNLNEKSLVQPDLVFIVPEINKYKWKSGWNLEKWSASGFFESRPEFDCQSCQLGWFRVKFSWVGWVRRVSSWFGQP